MITFEITNRYLEIIIINVNENLLNMLKILVFLSLSSFGYSQTAPVITSNGGGSSAGISYSENGTSTVTTVTSTDVDASSTSTYSISGTDADDFTINSSTGVLSFISSPNYESPTDSDSNNSYVVVVTVTDNTSLTDTQTLTVTVTDVNEAPVITSNGGGSPASISYPENGTASVTTVSSTDTDSSSTATYNISGMDVDDFSINSSSGALSFISSPNYESPADSDSNNSYVVVVTVTDNGSLTDTQTLTITVTDENEAISINSFGGADTVNLYFDENSILPITAILFSDEDSSTVASYSLSGLDMNDVAIDSAGFLTFAYMPNYESPTDNDLDNIYIVDVNVTDNLGLFDRQTLIISVKDINEVPIITNGSGLDSLTIDYLENSTESLIKIEYIDEDSGDIVYYDIYGADADNFQIDSSGVITFNSVPDYEMPNDTNLDNQYKLTVEVADRDSLYDDIILYVNVLNVDDESPIPTIIASLDSMSYTNFSPIPIELTFTEPVVGFDGFDIYITNASISNFLSSDTNYTFNIIPVLEDTILVNIMKGVCADSVGNLNEASNQVSFIYDITPPTAIVTIVEDSTESDLTVSTLKIQFSEPVFKFDTADILIENAEINSIEGELDLYILRIIPSGTGDVTIEFSDGIFEDAAGNPNEKLIFNLLYSELSIDEILVPAEFGIKNIFPNPFNPVTRIVYGVPEMMPFHLVVYDITGRRVKTLFGGVKMPGYYSIEWNASDLSSGVYFVHLKSNKQIHIQKLFLIK